MDLRTELQQKNINIAALCDLLSCTQKTAYNVLSGQKKLNRLERLGLDSIDRLTFTIQKKDV